MTLELFIRYLHFISLFTLVASLVGEHLLIRKEMMRSELTRMATLDGIYGLSAIVAVGAGLTLWFAVGKPAEFYSKNWIFHLKVGLAILMGVLSIWPTVFYIRNRRKKEQADESIAIPRYVFILLRIQILLLLFIPLCAVLMARGVGYFG
ncbi:MAG: DUF2214 family protein [Bacteroidota bacterium]